jgi:sodium/hydrogen antiporter
VKMADSRSWMTGPWRQILTLATAILAYAGAVALGGSGFIGAFVGGMTFGALASARDLPYLRFTEDGGELLAAVVWIGFGALALGKVLTSITWQMVAYAVISLTVVRMIPVALAMLGSHARRPTVAFMGWFGPRGLASIVFALIAFEDQVPDTNTLFGVVTVTVALSVIAHGLSSAPLVNVYRRWYAAHTLKRPDAEEAAPSVAPRARRAP